MKETSLYLGFKETMYPGGKGISLSQVVVLMLYHRSMMHDHPNRQHRTRDSKERMYPGGEVTTYPGGKGIGRSHVVVLVL